jgi:TolA-binding protein
MPDVPCRGRFCRGRAHPAGKITLVTLIAILGLVVLAGFVGNAGHVVTAKVNSQNAADAIAFSTAQWMARGMNAITATNHLLGEVTGIVVVLEGLGGPEADLEMEDYPPQSRVTDTVNRTLADMAYIQGLATYGAPAAGKLDKKFLDAVVKNLISKEEKDATHKAFATIYDSKLVLKRATTKRLVAKFFANWLLFVPPPWGYLSAAAGYAIHIVANVQLVEIGVEWVILHGMEKVVTSDVIRKLKVDVLEDKLVPALAAHGDFLAGHSSKVAQNRPKSEAGVVTHAVRQTVEHLQRVYGVRAVVYPTDRTYPLLKTLRLPIEAEPKPSMRRTYRDEKEWGDDELKFEDPDDQLDKMKEEIQDKKRKIQARINELQQYASFLRGLDAKIEELKKQEGVSQQERSEFEQEKREIAEDLRATEELIKKRTAELKELEAREKKMEETIQQLQAAPPGSGNISAERNHLALHLMDQAEERYTQWVRASYPYVDSFRAPMITLFRKHLDRSEAHKHYKKWTDRYTLVKSWKFRSGYRFYKSPGSKNRGEWREDPKTEPLRMYVMEGAYAKDPNDYTVIRTGRKDQKGHETWTQNSAAGKKLAEELFTVVAMTRRDIEPLFSPVIYPVATRNGMTTFAQAIFYNSNEQQPLARGAKSSTQAKLGWDTLNWDPAATVPEWGAPAATSNTAKWPWDVFKSDRELARRAAVRLNWQAKLMPVTKNRLQQAIPAALPAGETKMSRDLTIALPLFEEMVTH